MSLKDPNPNKSKLVRKPSPTRPEAEDAFRRKLEEIKKIRQKQNNNAERKKVIKIVNGKPTLDVQGDWALFQSSSGKKYFFNMKTMTNQWSKPTGWIEEGQTKPTQPPLPSSSSDQPPLPNEQNGSSTNGANKNPGFKMKIKKGSSKVKKKKNNELKPPLPPLPDDEEDPKDKLPKAYMDFSDDDDEPSSKLPKLEDEDYKDIEPDTSANPSDSPPPIPGFDPGQLPPGAFSEPPPGMHPGLPPSAPVPGGALPIPGAPPALPGPHPALQAVMAAKAMIESQLPPTAPQGITSANALLNNTTWLTDYNLPACLSRCKFPKTQDAIHELNSNRTKKRKEVNLPPIPPEVAQFTGSGFDVHRDMFLTELKNNNNRHRLLSDKLNGTLVFKIPDDLWDRYFSLFNVELLGPNITLECRPHGFTEDNVPVYTRTGKVANKLPFPEDIVRCHSVLQAWKTDTCHCVYANRTFTIERDDRQWKKDLEECKKFLIENGY